MSPASIKVSSSNETVYANQDGPTTGDDQTALENNPMLEVSDDEAAEPRENDAANESYAENSERKRNEEKLEKEKIKEEVSASSADDTIVEEHLEAAMSESSDSMTTDSMADASPDELPVDSVWEDVYDNSAPASSSSGSDGESRDFTEFHNSGISSIQDHLNDQIQFAPLSERDQVIAETLIDAVDNNGYLIDDVEVLLEGLNRDFKNP